MRPYTQYASTSGWNKIQPPDERCKDRSLSADLRTRFAIVGAGYAGAATARQLAECYPNDHIVLLDALAAGEGPAGRNSGFMIDRVDTKIDTRNDGPEADWQTHILQAGLEWLRHITAEHAIACDWQENGHYKTATTQQGAQELERLLTRLDSKQLQYRRLSQEEIRTEIGAANCTSAAYIPYCVLAQPAALIHGLLRTLPANVELYTRSPVHHTDRGNPHILTSGTHKIKADVVIFCNNVSLPFFGFSGSQQLTVYTYAGMTQELDDTELGKLGIEQTWGATPVERLGATTRKLASRRFLFRAGFSYKNETAPDQVGALLRRLYSERYPQMRTHAFEYQWGGALSMTRNGAPIFGKVAPNAYALSGCNASGILKMTALGKLLAESIAGIDSPLLRDTEQFARPQWIPPEPFRSLGVYYSIAQMKKAMRR